MARTTKNPSKESTLEEVLWNCRVALRGVGSSEKNRDAVVSLAFLKFAGDKFEKQREHVAQEYGDIPQFLDNPSFYNADNIFYLKEESRWSYIKDHASDADIAIKLDAALAGIEKDNPSLKGALPRNMYAGLSVQPNKLKTLIDEVAKLDNKYFQVEDLIGRVYEYFLRAYAAAGTKDEGEFYTPSSVVELIAELIEPFAGVVYDPCCGSGGMFIQSMKFVDAHKGNRKNISVVGQESNADTWRLCKMNLAIRGISHNLGERNESSFGNDQHKGRKVDFIMANPPFNLKNWRAEDELLKDERFKGYAMPPVSNANYAWILHMINKLNPNDGVAGFLLANGALQADGEEYKIRRELLERDLIEAIIVLPRDMFYTTDISVTLWIVSRNKGARLKEKRSLRDRSNQVLFMDLRAWDQNVDEILIDKGKKKKKVAFTSSQIDDVKRIFHSWQSVDGKYEDIPELCKSVSLDGANGIRSNDYSLVPSRYVEFVDRDLEIDFDHEMKRIQSEMTEILKMEKESQAMMESAFKEIGYEVN